ncbi:hypothetical protein Ancab_028813 [Ancistrocladus abbreviatus]
MDMSGNSEWSSGCESGWTGYLDESSPSPNPCQSDKSDRNAHENYRVKSTQVEQDDEEEDLSMVSDASSGPPHLQEFDDCFDRSGYHYSPSEVAVSKKNDKRKKGKEQRGKHDHSYLDDTASSPALSYSKGYVDPSNNQASIDRVLGYSQNFSQFKGNSEFGNHLGYNWQSSHGKKSDSAEPSHSRGRRWK